VANTLTRRDNKVEHQDQVKSEYRTRAFLSQDQVDPQVLQDLGIDVELSPIQEEEGFDESVGLLDQILRENREAPSLQALRIQAQDGDPDFELEDGLLLYNSRLVVDPAYVPVSFAVGDPRLRSPPAVVGKMFGAAPPPVLSCLLWSTRLALSVVVSCH
jgi:hypothetical protein